MVDSSASHATHAGSDCAPIPICFAFGYKVNPCTQSQLLDYVFAPSNVRQRVIASVNLHGMYMYTTNRSFRAVHDRRHTISHIDGLPVIWLANLAGLRLCRRQRTAWNDFLWPLLAHAAAERWRVFYLGSTPEVFERGLERIASSLKNLEIGGRHGYFDAKRGSAECQAVVDEINKFAPDILLIGMGMPRQEEFIHEVGDQLVAKVVMTCGAAMEVLVGALPRAPTWVSDHGLEWLFRLLYSPLRTWRRYLVEPWTVFLVVWRHYWSTLRQNHSSRMVRSTLRGDHDYRG